MPNYKIHVNSKYSDVQSDNFLEIVDGAFVGVHFNFGKVEFGGEDELGNGVVKFDYNLLHIPENIILEIDKPLLERELGSILQHILETMVDNNKENNNETRTGDTESTTEG